MKKSGDARLSENGISERAISAFMAGMDAECLDWMDALKIKFGWAWLKQVFHHRIFYVHLCSTASLVADLIKLIEYKEN